MSEKKLEKMQGGNSVVQDWAGFDEQEDLAKQLAKGQFVSADVSEPDKYKDVPTLERVTGPFPPGRTETASVELGPVEVLELLEVQEPFPEPGMVEVDILVKETVYPKGHACYEHVEVAPEGILLAEGEAEDYISDPWAIIYRQSEAAKEEREALSRLGCDPEQDRGTKKLWDFTCEECGQTQEKFAYNDEPFIVCGLSEYGTHVHDEEAKVLGVNPIYCKGQAHRDVPIIASWSPSAERTQAQLKERSLKHGRHNLKRGHSMKQNETYKNTSSDWHSKTRARNTRKGVVAEKQNEYKDYAEKPPMEFRPMGDPIIHDGKATYKKRRSLE